MEENAVNIIEIVENNDMKEEACYFCGNQIWLRVEDFVTECGLCGETVRFEPDLEQKHDCTISCQKVTCPLCKNDIFIHPGVGPISCDHCREVLHFGSSRVHRKPYECEICGRRFRQQDQAEKHAKKHEGPRLDCKHCCQSFTDVSKRKNHELSHEENSAAPGIIKPLVCSLCNKSFYSKFLLTFHLKTHDHDAKAEAQVEDPGRIFACELCGKKFAQQRYLEMHKLAHVPKSQFQCRFCESLFGNKIYRGRHERKHTKKEFCCQFCGIIIRTKQYFVQHIEQHRQDILNKCFVPEETFAERSEDKNVSNHCESSTTSTAAFGKVSTDGTDDRVPKQVCSPPSKVLPIIVNDFECGRCGVSFMEWKGLEEHECYSTVYKSDGNSCAKSESASEESDFGGTIEEYILKLVHDNRFLSSGRINKLAQEKFPFNYDYAHTTRVRHVLKMHGFSFGGNVTKLDNEMQQLRLSWATHYSTWKEADWAKVLWSGTARFRRYATTDVPRKIFSIDARNRLWRHEDEDPSEKAIRSSSSSKASLHVWGCISSCGFGKLYRLNGELNGASYLDLLQNSMLPCAWSMIGPDFILHHESRKVYAKDFHVQEWLSNPSPSSPFDVLDFPLEARDLNPLENFWNTLCRELDGFDSDDIDDLWNEMEVVAAAIPRNFFASLIKTMHRRCATVILAGGGNITCI